MLLDARGLETVLGGKTKLTRNQRRKKNKKEREEKGEEKGSEIDLDRPFVRGLRHAIWPVKADLWLDGGYLRGTLPHEFGKKAAELALLIEMKNKVCIVCVGGSVVRAGLLTGVE